MKTKAIKALLLSLGAAATLATSASASLLSPTGELQLESWLGQGNLDFTNIFTKVQSSTSQDFHTAADGQGATFSLLTVTGGTLGSAIQLIGGYNPQSWSYNGDWYYTYTDAERTAFLFNLSSNEIQRQNKIGEGDSGAGPYQTYNKPFYGPTFGGGHDLNVAGDLGSGYAYNYSYGATSYGDAITVNPNGANYLDYFNVLELEVYTIAPSQTRSGVPDTGSTAALLGLGFVALATLRRHTAK